MSKLRCIAFGVCAALLTGCLLPEHFKAGVDFNEDGSYAYRYSGTAIHVLGAMQLKQAKVLSAKDDAQLKAFAVSVAKRPDVRSMTYRGDARYQLDMDGRGNAGQSFSMLDFLRISTDKAGVTTVFSPAIKESDRRQLAQLGVKIDGTLDVKLPKNAEIISQNATSEPKFFGMFGTYSWKIGAIDQTPLLKFRVKH